MKHLTRNALAAGAVLALVAGVSSLPASAAPIGANAELKGAVATNTIDVQGRHRWHRRRAAIALGALGVGVVAGAAIANANRGYYYDQPYGYYDQPYVYYEPQPYGYTYYGNPYVDPYGGNY